MIPRLGTYVFIKKYSGCVDLPVDCQDLILYEKCVTPAVVNVRPDLHAFLGYSAIGHPGGVLAEMMKRALEKEEICSSFHSRGALKAV